MSRSIFSADMRGQRNTVVVVGIALLAALLMVGLLAPPAHAAIIFTVNSTGDGGDVNLNDNICDASNSILTSPCTLRAAIQEANDTPGADEIDFEIGGPSATGVKTISPTSAPLPFITEAVIINGYTQPGASPNTLDKGTNAKLKIQLSGANLSVINEFGLFFFAPNCVVKGLVINRFDDGGIVLSTSSSNSSVRGNFIGTNPAGTQDLGNGHDGVAIALTARRNTTIGGDTPAARNLISGTQLHGVEINADESTVVGNLIGTDKYGTSPIANSFDGVRIGSTSNIVGSNTIAFNGSDGVTISSGISNSILSNSIFSNGFLGIDLLGEGPTPNDPQDPDTGANNLQNKPVLTSAVNSSGTTTIKGRLNSTPNETFTIEFFSNPSGTDEGKIFLGKKEVTTGQDGLFLFQKTFSPAVNKGRTITATATNTTTHDTSEFSAPRTVTSA